MNKHTMLLSLASLLFPLASCQAPSIFLERPAETNLGFWITEKVDKEALKSCTFLPGWFGGDEYLDSRYKATKKENGSYEIPEHCVTYFISAYPDYSDGGSYVTKIRITDPEVNVYGMTLDSHPDQVRHTMMGEGFEDNQKGGWSKNNCVFVFSSDEIVLSATVTNNKGIVF